MCCCQNIDVRTGLCSACGKEHLREAGDQETKWWCDEKYWNNECQEVWHQRALVPAIIAEAERRERQRIYKKVEGLRRKSDYGTTGRCSICEGDHIQRCLCDEWNAALDEVLRIIGERI